MREDKPHQVPGGHATDSLAADVWALAAGIGPRGTGTPGEAAAADYVARRLAGSGLTPSRRAFSAVRSQNAYPLSIDLVAAGALALGLSRHRPCRWLGAGLGLACGPLLWRAIRLSTNPLRPTLPKVVSGSVTAVVPARSVPRRKVTILAHLDTNRCRLAWRAGTVRWLEPLTWLTLGMHVSLGALLAVRALLSARPARQVAQLERRAEGAGLKAAGRHRSVGRARCRRLLDLGLAVAASYIAGTAVTLVRDDRTPFSPGAHDNAASVAVALELARRLTAAPLDHSEVWLVFTGAEETDHAGLYALLSDHPPDPQNDVFIGLEGLGSGELVYLTSQGLCDRYGPDARTLLSVERAAVAKAGSGARPARMTLEDEVGTLRRLGYRAVCVAGMEPATGTLPHWHTADDTAQTVSPEFMLRAVEFLQAVLDELDGEE